jgi:hypothetical protein
MRHKHDEESDKQPTDANVPLGIRERLRNQWEAIGIARHVLDGLDHSVRYGLIIFSAVNTGAVILIVRRDMFAALGPAALVILKVLGGLYVAVALWILFYAIRSLSPRLPAKELARLIAQTGAHRAVAKEHILHMTLRPGAPESTLTAFHEGWQTMTGEELSLELSEAILIAKHMMERKHAVLNRLYPALAVMLFLAALLIIVLATIPGP